MIDDFGAFELYEELNPMEACPSIFHDVDKNCEDESVGLGGLREKMVKTYSYSSASSSNVAARTGHIEIARKCSRGAFLPRLHRMINRRICKVKLAVTSKVMTSWRRGSTSGLLPVGQSS